MKTTAFKTIVLGKKKPDLNGFEISGYAYDLLEKVEYQNKKQSVDLVVLTPADLGFTSYPTTTELFARAKEQGYDLCPAEIGPRLRAQYKDQPNGEWLSIANEPITDSGGYPGVFAVGRDSDGGRWLHAGWADPEGQWDLGGRVVFRLRKDTVSSDLEPSDLHSDTLNLELRLKNLEAFQARVIELIPSLNKEV